MASKKPLIVVISIFLGFLLISLIGYYFLIQGGPGEGGQPSVFKNFFPFGGNSQSTDTPIVNNPTEPQNPNGPVNFTNKLRKLSSEPVSGAGTLDVKAGTIVRYIEKATGHIFEVELFSPKQGRISNTTIPVVYDALWGNKNTSLVARYLEDDDQTVDTYGLTIKQASTTTEAVVSAVSLPANISDVSVNAAIVFYIQQNIDTSNGYIANFDGSKRKQIWSSPIKDLLSQFVNQKTIALTTKPAENIPGFLYFVDTNSGGVRKILGDVPGLSTLVNDSESTVFYLSQGATVASYVFDIKTRSATAQNPVTFPEKCVWSKKDKTIMYCAVPEEVVYNTSLTLWYKGFLSFTDQIWKYDTKNNIASIVENLSADSGETIDVMKPILSENEQYLVFINKKDNSLWSLDLLK